MTTSCMNISAAVIKLAQYTDKPAKCHYQAAKQVLLYLYATCTHGIYYWQPEPMNSLPQCSKDPNNISQNGTN